jgi:transposase
MGSNLPPLYTPDILQYMGVAVVDMRELKALEIAAKNRIGFDGANWIVRSQSGICNYRVQLEPVISCDCDDFQTHNTPSNPCKPCKHIIAARVVRERDYGDKNPTEIIVNEVPKRPTYRQNWPLYDKAQQTEKNRVQELLTELCYGIKEPERASTRRGRKPIPLADQIFSMVFKVYCGMSSRRFNCDLDEAHAKGHMAKPIKNARQVCEFFENAEMTPILKNLIVQSSLPLRSVETVFAPDSTGFSSCRFEKWFDEKWGDLKSSRTWVKAHAVCGVKTNIVTALEVAEKFSPDCPEFKGMIETTLENFKLDYVAADKGYLSRENLEMVDGRGGEVYIPFKSNSVPGESQSIWEKMFLFYNLHRESFLKKYHQRSNIESTFAMVKAKFDDSVRSKSDVAMRNEVYCKFLAHNLCVVHQSMIELGIEGVFWKEEPEVIGNSILHFPARVV